MMTHEEAQSLFDKELDKKHCFKNLIGFIPVEPELHHCIVIETLKQDYSNTRRLSER